MSPAIERDAWQIAARFLLRDEIRFGEAHTWLVFLSALDLMLTGVVLLGLDGIEANPLAAYVIGSGGFIAGSLFKYSLVVIAIILCEVVGRMKHDVGKRLSWAMVMIGVTPVAWTLSLLSSSIAWPILMDVWTGP